MKIVRHLHDSFRIELYIKFTETFWNVVSAEESFYIRDEDLQFKYRSLIIRYNAHEIPYTYVYTMWTLASDLFKVKNTRSA